MTIRRGVFAAIFAVVLAAGGVVAAPMKAMVYKDISCGCCHEYIAYLNKHGIAAIGKNVADIWAVKQIAGIPDDMASCHTMMIDGYIVEGHVPLAAIERMLHERPDIVGIALPGMPPGSPGMNGEKEDPFTIYAITKSGAEIYMVM